MPTYCIQQAATVQSGMMKRRFINNNDNNNNHTHIPSGEQGAIGLRHVHVVVVILELWMKTKKKGHISCDNTPVKAQVLSSIIMDTCHSNTLGSQCLHTHTLLTPFFRTCTSISCPSAIIETRGEACERPGPIQSRVMRICSGHSALMGSQLKLRLHHKAKYRDAVAGY